MVGRETGINLPKSMDVLRPVQRLFGSVPSYQQTEEMHRMLSRYTVVVSTVVSCIEYVRIVQDFFGDLLIFIYTMIK